MEDEFNSDVVQKLHSVASIIGMYQNTKKLVSRSRSMNELYKPAR